MNLGQPVTYLDLTVDFLRRRHPEPVTVAEVADALGRAGEGTRKTLDELCAHGRARRAGTRPRVGRGSREVVLYALAEDDESDDEDKPLHGPNGRARMVEWVREHGAATVAEIAHGVGMRAGVVNTAMRVMEADGRMALVGEQPVADGRGGERMVQVWDLGPKAPAGPPAERAKAGPCYHDQSRVGLELAHAWGIGRPVERRA